MRSYRGFVFLLTFLVLGVGANLPAVSQTPAWSRSDSLWAKGERTAAVEILEQMAEQAAANRDTSMEAAALTRLGARQIAAGSLGPAANGLRRAASLATAVQDTVALLPAIRWWSLSAGLRGRTAEADSLNHRLYELAQVTGDRGHQGWACVGFASRQLDIGNPELAADWYREAADHLLAAGEPGGELWARNGLGIALGRQRLFHQALAVYQDVAQRAHDLGSAMSEANATNNIGNHLMLLGDPGAAQTAFRQAAALFESQGMTASRMTPALNLAICEMELGNLDAAAAILDSNLVLSRNQGLAESRGRFLVEKARLETTRGRYNAARLNLDTALAMGDTLAAAERARVVSDLVEMTIRQDKPAEALSILDRWLPQLPVQGLGTVSWELDQARAGALLATERTAEALEILQAMDSEVTASGVDRTIISGKLLLARAHLASGQTRDAVDQLRLAAQVWEAQRGKPGEYRWREVRAAGGREVFLLLARLIYENPELAQGDSLTEIFRIMQTYKGRTLLERTAGPAFAESLNLGTAEYFGLNEFQSTLQPRDLVLDWYTGPEFSLLLAVTDQEIRLVVLPDETELNRRVDLYLELLAMARPLEAGSSENLQAASASLLGILLDPVADLLAGARLVQSSPDGPLHRLPLEVVWLYAGGETKSWQLTPSLSFRGGRGGRETGCNDGILLLAGSLGPRGENIEGPALELADLQHRFGKVQGILVNENSPPLEVSLLEGRRVLHLASHVLMDHQLPWQSAINLPFSGSSGEPGPLAAANLLELDLSSDLTVLNGCGTASGRVMSGEGSSSLATAFLTAGSRSVVATLWPVDDLTAQKFSAAFYTFLGEGLPIGLAVAAAQDALRKDPATAAPLQWGAYVVFGEGDRQVSLTKRRSGLKMAGVGLLLGALVLAGVLAKARRPAE